MERIFVDNENGVVKLLPVRLAPMSGTTIVLLVPVTLLVLSLIGVGRMAWRVLRHNEQMEAGGSLSQQMFKRYEKKRSE